MSDPIAPSDTFVRDANVVFHGEYTWWSDAKPSRAVIAALCEVTGREQDELPPLYSTVDTEALDALFRPPKGRNPHIRLNLTVEDFDIMLTGDGDLFVLTQADDPVS